MVAISGAIPGWIRNNLTTEQARPLQRGTQNACILASAGSGKTRTLVHLLAQELACGVAPEGIIAFTFTERAAAELRARIDALVRTHLPHISTTSMFIGTIHSWCYKFLLDQPDFYNIEAIDELHVDSLISRLYDTLGLGDAYGKPYPKAIDPFIADLDVFYNENLALAAVPATIRPCIAAFTDILRENRLLTFGGMITHAIKHLQVTGPVPALQRLYCDEYQDVNPAQVTLMQAMAGPETQVVAVGDDLQCIYQWRGSDVERILEFGHDFADTEFFYLGENFRSRPDIVQTANSIASAVSVRYPKSMTPTRSNGGADAVAWLSALDDDDQAAVVADVVASFIARGVPPGKIAILMRSVSKQGQPIADALAHRAIPVESPILGRNGGFVQSFLLPVFEWVAKEHQPPRNEQEEDEAYQRMNDLWATVSIWMPTDSSAEDRFWDALNDWMTLVADKRGTAYDVRGRLYDFLDRCGVRVTPQQHDLMAGLGIGSQIIRSVEEMHRRRIQGSTRRTPRGLLTEIVHALRREAPSFGETVPVVPSTDAVLITTVHQAKGLEWPVVIVPSLNQARFPHSTTPQQTSFPDEIAGRYGTNLDDERRLFYVAATRARERLVLVDAAGARPDRRSRFLIDLQAAGRITPASLTDMAPSFWALTPDVLRDADPNPTLVGLSDLLMYAECPYQFGLRRRANIQASVSDELGYGKGLHEIIQRRFESATSWSPAELADQVDSHVHLPLMSESDEQKSRSAIAQRVSTLERLGVFNGALDAEVPVDVPLSSGFVSGIIDGVIEEPDGSVVLRDWKANVHDELLPRYRLQLQFYAYALRLLGRTVRRAELIDVGASAKSRTLKSIPVAVDPTTTQAIVHSLTGAIDGITRGDYAPQASVHACAACDMRRICADRWIPDRD